MRSMEKARVKVFSAMASNAFDQYDAAPVPSVSTAPSANPFDRFDVSSVQTGPASFDTAMSVGTPPPATGDAATAMPGTATARMDALRDPSKSLPDEETGPPSALEKAIPFDQPLIDPKYLEPALRAQNEVLTGGVTNLMPAAVTESMRGFEQGEAKIISGLTSPKQLATAAALGPLALAGKVGQGLVGGVFLGQQLMADPQQWKALKGAKTLREQVAIGTQMLGGHLLPALAVAHAAALGKPATAVIPNEPIPAPAPETTGATEPSAVLGESPSTVASDGQPAPVSQPPSAGVDAAALRAERVTQVAIRNKTTGKISTGVNHTEAFLKEHPDSVDHDEWSGLKNEITSQYEKGFVTDKGRFLSPKDAHKLVTGEGSGELAHSDIAPTTGRVVGPTLIDKQGKPIVQGKIGQTHADLMRQAIGTPQESAAIDALANDKQHAFTLQDESGNFTHETDREAVGKAGVASGQLPEGFTGPANSEDFNEHAKTLEAKKASAPQSITSIKNEQVDLERQQRGLPAVTPIAKRGFGEVWDQAAAKIDANPNYPDELISELQHKPRALTDVEDAALLHRQVDLQNQFAKAADALDKAHAAGDEAGIMEQRARTSALSDQLLELYNVGKKAGTETGRGLNARKLLAAEDFSLASMITQKRAAMGGKPLSAEQTAEVGRLQAKITELQKAVDAYESKTELAKQFKDLLKASSEEAKQAATQKKGIGTFLEEQANKARERIKARGARLTTGLDPVDSFDRIVIGADHLAKGATSLASWSAKMVGEFGETIRPFLKDLYEKAKQYRDASLSAMTGKEDSRLKAMKTRTINRTAELQAKTSAGDFTTTKRTPIRLDAEGERLKADLARAQNDWRRGLGRDRAQNRTTAQKFWDRFVGVERAMKLTSDVVLAKLTLAAAAREMVLTPAEELAGGAISKSLPGLAKRAPREGGFSPRAEIEAKVQMLTQGMKDSWDNLRMRKSNLEELHGKKEFTPQEWYEYMGYLHGALKAPVKRAEFARSVAKRMAWAVSEGKDINNPNVVRELSDEAYVDANRSIFMQDNVVSQMFSNAMRSAEQSKIAPNLGPGLARMGKFLVPIVKVPTNIVGEVATGVHGLASGGFNAARAYIKGIESLPTDQGDMIMRQLKKGLVGNGLLLAGYFGYKSIGGFYHDQDKRDPSDVKAGSYRIGGVDLPRSAGHSTAAMLLNIGATVHRVQDERIKNSDPATKGFAVGVGRAAAGLAEQLPFVPAMTGAADAIGTQHGFEKYISGLISSSTTPGVVSHAARVIDTPGTFPKNILDEPTARKPTSVGENLKMGIPGLRQTVPEKATAKPPKGGHRGYVPHRPGR